jgi:hypothetical protein
LFQQDVNACVDKQGSTDLSHPLQEGHFLFFIRCSPGHDNQVPFMGVSHFEHFPGAQGFRVPLQGLSFGGRKSYRLL